MSRFNFKNKNIQFTDDFDYESLSKFYTMLVKYKKQHPKFNLNGLMLKLYPKLNLKYLKKIN